MTEKAKYGKIIVNFLKIALLAILIVVVIAAVYHYVLKHDIKEDSSNKKNVPAAIRNYTNNTKISEDGKVEFEMTAAELWGKLKEEGSDILKYLDSAEELAKLMNVQIAVESLYTGEDPENAVINTRKFAENIDSKEVQGIVKLKRAYKNSDNQSEEIYMKYKSPEEFKKLIEKYNLSGSEEDRLEAMKYFTLEKRRVRNSSSINGTLPVSMQGMLIIGDSIAGCILNNTTIKEDGATVVYKTSASPEYFLGEQNLSYDSNIAPATGTFDMNRDLASITNPTGIYLILGQNSCGNSERLTNMNRLVEKLQEKYPNIPIYINSVIPKAEDENSEYNKNAKNMNQELKDYCDSVSGLYYSDVLSGYKERVNEFAGSDSGTKIHPNREGSKVLYDNMKANISEIAENSSSNTSNSSGTSNNTTNVSYDSNTLHWPIPESKTVISEFGKRDLDLDVSNGGIHTGVDIGAQSGWSDQAAAEAFEGADIEAADSGTVVKAEFDSFNGNYVLLKHDSGIISYYGHMKEYIVNTGDSVNRGQLIGYVGKTGSAQGTVPHLHFQVCPAGGNIWRDYVDPMSFTYEYNDYGRNGAQDNGSTSSYVAKVARYYETSESGSSSDPNVKVEVAAPTHEMTEQEIDYKAYISPYTMPFNYLWTMLLLSQDKDFTFALADLVYNSKLEITVRDNESIDKNVRIERYQYKNHYETKNIYLSVSYKDEDDIVTIPRLGPYDGGQHDDYFPSAAGKYTVTHTRTVKSDNLDIGLTLADAWYVKTVQEYEYKYEGEKLVTNQESSIADAVTATANTETDPARLAENVRANVERQYKRQYGEASATLLSSNTACTRSTVNKTLTVQKYLTESKHINKPIETTENINPVTKESKFTKIYKEYSKARANIYPEWLFEFLECNEDTKDLVDLTKYLMYKATGENYGVSDFNTVWQKILSGYTSIGGNKSGLDGNVGIIFDFLLSKGVSPQGCAGIIGNWMQESGCMPNNLENGANSRSGLSDEEFTNQVNNGTISKNEFISSSRFKASESYGSNIYGYGLAQWTSQGRKANLYDFAKSYTGYSNGFDISDINMQLEYFWKELQGYPEALDAIVNATDVANATHVFHRKYEISADLASTTRIKYAEEVYNKYLANQRNGIKGNGDIVKTAIAVHRYLRTNGFEYGNGTYVPNTTSKYVDCSSYVTWVMIEAGVPGFTAGQKQELAQTFEANKWGFQEVPVSNKQPGDILCFNGPRTLNHVEIYAGRDSSGADRVYNCGANEWGIWYAGTSDFPEASYQSHSDADITKVLRVNK